MTDARIMAADETGRGPLSLLCDKEWQDLLDKSDRTSPSEYPDMALITRVEFGGVMSEAFLLAKTKPEPNPEYEAKAKAAHEQIRDEAGVNPFDTLTMLERWTADAEPANHRGQVSFSRALLDSATDALRNALEIGRNEYLRAERAIRSLKAIQDGASLAMATLPNEGVVPDFLAAIHREAVRGQLISDEVTNEAAPTTDGSDGR
jgi:hypothetical protein